MAEGTVRYDADKNTIYAVAGDTQLGEELVAFAAKWDALVVNNDMSDFNTIFDVSRLDPKNYKPLSDDGGWHGLPSDSTRKRGDGKVVVVISRSKGGATAYQNLWSPDAIVNSIEDAEAFIATGILYDK